ncbi:MAG: pyrroline-5-carboxylate reductase [Methanobacteriota archaeon]
MEQRRIAVIGAGNMGTALVRGMLKAHWCRPGNIMATGPHEEKIAWLTRELKVTTSTVNGEAVRWADTVILGVKPQIIDRVLDEIRPAIQSGTLVVSIAAGVTTAHIESKLPPGTAVVRSMPNVAVTVEFGATAICPGKSATGKDLEVARKIFEAVGVVVDVSEELMDAVTGLSGTGPMYIFQIIEGLSDAGVRVGLSRDVSNRLTVQTVLGAAKMVQESGKHPGYLKDLVTSPGGTAIAALHSLERNGLRALLMDAVQAATHRSAELGGRK